MRNFRRIKPRRNPASSGMTLVELTVAIVMLLVFGGVVVMVNETIYRFLYPVEQTSSGGLDRSNGLLIDRQELRQLMSRLNSLLEQPGISRERLLGLEEPNPQIAYDFTTSPSEACVVNPIRAWNLPLESNALDITPVGYRICLWATSRREAPMTQLMLGETQASPGVYVLQAIPEQLTTSHLPIRMLLCRPAPFC